MEETGNTPVAIRPELAAALAKAQAEIQSAGKDAINPYFKSKYATLDSIWEACRAPLTKNGLSVIQLVESEGPELSLTTILCHESGGSVQSTLSMSINPYTPQGMGLTVTYLRKYGLASMVGVTAGDDDDGEASRQAAEQARSKPYQNTGERQANPGEERFGLRYCDDAGKWREPEYRSGLKAAEKRAKEMALELNRKVYVTDSQGVSKFEAEPPTEALPSFLKPPDQSDDPAKVLADAKIRVTEAKKLIGGTDRSAGLALTSFFVGFFGVKPPPRIEAEPVNYSQALLLLLPILENPEGKSKFLVDPQGLGFALSGRGQGDGVLAADFEVWGWDKPAQDAATAFYKLRGFDGAAEFRTFVETIKAGSLDSRDAQALFELAQHYHNAYKVKNLADSSGQSIEYIVKTMRDALGDLSSDEATIESYVTGLQEAMGRERRA